MPQPLELCGAAASFVMFIAGLVSFVTVIGALAT